MLGDMTVRPFLTGRYIAVQDMAYYWGWGGGVVRPGFGWSGGVVRPGLGWGGWGWRGVGWGWPVGGVVVGPPVTCRTWVPTAWGWSRAWVC